MMCDVLRQWLYMTDQNRQAYEKRAGAESKEEHNDRHCFSHS